MANKSRYKKMKKKDSKRIKREKARIMQEKRKILSPAKQNIMGLQKFPTEDGAEQSAVETTLTPLDNVYDGRMRESQQGGEEDVPSALPPAAPGVEHVSEDIVMTHNEDEGDESEGELCIQIKEETDEAIPVQLISSSSGLALATPQYNISVASTSVDSQERAYSISINEIQDPLSHENVDEVTMKDSLNEIPQDNLLRPRGVITVPDDLLRTGQFNYVPKRGRPRKVDSAMRITNGTKRKSKVKETDGDDPNIVNVVKRNPPRLAKTMTNAQELMNRKLTDIIKSQNYIVRTLREMPGVANEDETKSSSKEDRFDICGKHIASLLRELPTFDALALEAKLMDIVYKEREKIETFRRSLQCYSAVMLPQNEQVDM